MATSALAIAAEYFPDATRDDLDYIIWEQTGYPAFWNIPHDGNTPEECFRSQLLQFKLFGRSCYRCGAYGTGRHGKPVVRRRQDFCDRCKKLMAKERQMAR